MKVSLWNPLGVCGSVEGSGRGVFHSGFKCNLKRHLLRVTLELTTNLTWTMSLYSWILLWDRLWNANLLFNENKRQQSERKLSESSTTPHGMILSFDYQHQLTRIVQLKPINHHTISELTIDSTIVMCVPTLTHNWLSLCLFWQTPVQPAVEL